MRIYYVIMNQFKRHRLQTHKINASFINSTSPGKLRSAFKRIKDDNSIHLSSQILLFEFVKHEKIDWTKEHVLKNVQIIFEHSGNSLEMVSKDFTVEVWV